MRALLALAAPLLFSLSVSCGGSVDLTSCTGPGKCSLVPKTCCGNPCGAPTPATYESVTKGSEGAHHNLVCGSSPPECPAYGCPAPLPEASVMALCRGTTLRCEAVDIREDPVSACATDDDCVLHYSSCCQPCEAPLTDLVALAKTQIESFRKYVCVGDEVCSKCMTYYPAGMTAYCEPATKHCGVKRG
jgi:hypothetical protein